jgi:hypothetical protein
MQAWLVALLHVLPIIVQFTHAPPAMFEPHWVLVSPGSQRPAALQQPLAGHAVMTTQLPVVWPAGMAQHPILHGEVALQVVPHTLLMHACWFPQSIATSHATQWPVAEQAAVGAPHIVHAAPA